MKQLVFIGIDVSKLSLDLCTIEKDKRFDRIKNNSTQIKAFFNKIISAYGVDQIIVGVENTGMYNWNLNNILNELSITYYLINPLTLKRSLGLSRGKNDTIDSERIVKYTQKNYSELEPAKTPEKELIKLKLLIAQRKRLISSKSALTIAMNELVILKDKTMYSDMKKINSKTIEDITKAIKKVEALISQLINKQATLKTSYNLITSVPGVGPVLAWELIIKTNNFESITEPRKLACYAGVVPFEHQSGTSIYKKPRVSNFADRSLKKLLHMAALRVTQLDGELQGYYFRKVAEGKNKMSVINAIRNKIIHRVFATIKNQKQYQNYLLMS